MRTAGAVVVAVLALAGCGHDRPERESAPTTSTTATTGAAGAEWSRPCTTATNEPGGDDHGGDTFGPLGTAPSIVVELPHTNRSVASAAAALDWPRVAWGRLRGATVVAAAPGESSDASSSFVSAVDDDGTVRWTRCLDGTVTAVGTGARADVVLVAVYPQTGRAAYTKDGTTLVLDARDGAERARFDRIDDIYATSSTRALVGRTDPDSSTPKVLALVDLATGERTDVTPPPPTDGPVTFELTDDGSPRFDGSVWRDGTWVPDPDPPIVVAFDESTQPSTLVAEVGGTVRWRLRLERPGLEGRGVLQGDRTAVAWSCGPRDPQGQCRLDLVGVDVASGRVLWTEAGDPRQQQVIGVGGDDAFLAESDGAWVMQSLRTGRPIEGQRWTDREAFLQGCCGDYDHYRAERFGGTVLVLHETEVRVWFPKAQSHPTVKVQP